MARATMTARARAAPARIALALRRTMLVPGGPLEDFYQRWVRPWGRRLLPRPVRASLGSVSAWPSPVIASGPIERVLVVKLDHMGDFLLAAPAFALLRRSFPHSHLTLLCGPWNVPLAEASGWFDAIVPLQFFAARAEDPRPVLDGGVLVGLGAFDLAIDLRVDEDTRPVLTRVQAGLRAGYASRGVTDLAITLDRPEIDAEKRGDLAQHQRQLLLNLVAAVLGHDLSGETAALVRRVAQTVPQAAGWSRPVVVMNTGSGRAIKNWPLDRFIALGRRLQAERGATLVLLGGAEQAEDAAVMRAALGPAGVVDLVGKLPMAGSLSVVAAADAYIGNDTALGHASAALGKSTVVLFSGIDPLPSWAALGARAVAVKAEVSCSPCHLSDLSDCPNGHKCMTAITPDEVWRVLPGVIG